MPGFSFPSALRKVLKSIQALPASKARQSLLKALLRMVERPDLDGRLDALEAHCRAHRLLTVLGSLRASSESGQWAAAIYQERVLGLSRRVIEARRRALGSEYLLSSPSSTWGLLDALAAEAGVELGTHSRELQEADPLPGFAANAHRIHERVRVIIQQEAAETMLLCAVETYWVKPKGKKKHYTELFGLCIGHVKQRDDGAVFVNVERFVPQLRASADHESVMPNEQSIDQHLKLIDRLMPEKTVVGAMHTHPYDDLKELLDRRGWRFSTVDSLFSRGAYPYWLKQGHRPEVEVIVAVAEKHTARKHSNEQRFGTNTHSYTLAGCELVFSAYRVRRDGEIEHEPIHLELRFSPSMK
jgi:hypothetical protein